MRSSVESPERGGAAVRRTPDPSLPGVPAHRHRCHHRSAHRRAGDRRPLHELPLVPLGQRRRRLAIDDRDSDRARGVLHRRVLRRLLGEPAHRRPGGAEGVVPGSRAGFRASLPGGGGAASFRLADARVGRPCPHRRRRDGLAMAEVAPVRPRRLLRSERPAVPQGRRVLRLQAAVPVVPRGLDPGGPDRAGDRVRGGVLPERGASFLGNVATRRPEGDVAFLGDLCRSGTAARRRILLRRPLRPRRRPERLVPGRRVHRRTRPPSRPQPAGDHRSGCLRHVRLQRLCPRLDAARGGGGPLGLRGDRHRCGVSLGGAVVAGESRPEHGGASLLAAQHRRHAGCLRPREHQPAVVPGQPRRHDGGGPGRRPVARGRRPVGFRRSPRRRIRSTSGARVSTPSTACRSTATKSPSRPAIRSSSRPSSWACARSPRRTSTARLG